MAAAAASKLTTTGRRPKLKRPVGLVRVSQPGERHEEDGDFHSPPNQREAIRELCAEHDDWGEPLILEPELHVSGTAPLDERPQLLRAVTMIQTGVADVLIGSYAARLWRSTEVRNQALRLIEGAGGEVWTDRDGRITNGTAARKFTGGMTTMADEYVKDQARENSMQAVQRAIDRGVPPWPRLTPGYDRAEADDPDWGIVKGQFVPNADAPAVLEAFKLRARKPVPATIAQVRAYLAQRGVKLGYRGTQTLLCSRVVRGEIHFGDYAPNLKAHTAIVPEPLWRDVQRATAPRGRRAQSDRLLARLGVLRCGTCKDPMVVGHQTQNGRMYPFYRCGHVREDCDGRVTISAAMAEQAVEDAVRAAIADEKGRASAEQHAREAEQAVERAEEARSGFVAMLSGFEDVDSTRERLGALTVARDEARERLEQLGGGRRTAITIRGGIDWDRLTTEERRALIRVTVERVVVAPGRGSDRITVELFGQ